MDQSRSYHSVGSNDREVCDCRSIFTDVTDQVVSVLAAENDQNVKVTVDRVVDGDTFVTYGVLLSEWGAPQGVQ